MYLARLAAAVKRLGVAKYLALGYLACDFGGLVLCAKKGSSDTSSNNRYSRLTGREDDLKIVDASGKYRFNFLDAYFYRRAELMAKYYRVYLNAKKHVILQDPEYDTILKFFHGTLVVGCVGWFSGGSENLIYHPGQTKDNIIGLIKVGMVILTFGGLYNQSSKLANISRFTREEEAIYNYEMAKLSMSAQKAGRSIPNNISNFVQHFKDAEKFPDQGYYSDAYSSNPLLQIAGQIHTSNLVDIPIQELKQLGLA